MKSLLYKVMGLDKNTCPVQAVADHPLPILYWVGGTRFGVCWGAVRPSRFLGEGIKLSALRSLTTEY